MRSGVRVHRALQPADQPGEVLPAGVVPDPREPGATEGRPQARHGKRGRSPGHPVQRRVLEIQDRLLLVGFRELEHELLAA